MKLATMNLALDMMRTDNGQKDVGIVVAVYQSMAVSMGVVDGRGCHVTEPGRALCQKSQTV